MITKKYRDFSLKHKIQLIILFCIFSISAAGFISIYFVKKSHEQVLYRFVSSNLTCSATEIYDTLTETENLAMMILSNNSIQEVLPLIESSESRAEKQLYINTIYNTLCNHLFNTSIDPVSYISIQLNNEEISTYSLLARQVPGNVKKELVSIAKKEKGGSVWVTDYSREYGLFLVKELRETRYLSLHPLGTLIININLDDMISQAASHDSAYDSMSFLLAANNRLIYSSEDITENYYNTLQKSLKQKYDILTLDNNPYFAVGGHIPGYQWDYFCIVPYDSIARTLSFTLKLCIIAMIFSVGVVFIASTSILSSLTRHFDWLIYKMNRFGEGHYTLPEDACDYSQRKDEIGQLHTNFNSMANKVDTLIRENYVNELLKKEAQLKALESQMEPHFLYNTLDSINWRAKAIKAEDISQITTALGNLLRISLSKNNYPFSIQQEMNILENYMTIQKLRYPHRLEYSIDIPEKFHNCEIPKFTIQPLLENAIRYGLEEISEICYISVTAFASDRNLMIEVKNNGSQFDDDLLQKLEAKEIQPHGFGIGILNIHKRLKIAYGPDYGLYLYNTEDPDDGEEYAVARIILPFIPLTKGDS